MYGTLISWPMLAAVAPFIGSFLCVVIARLPAGKTVVYGRSRCEACGGTIRPIDLVPILSWLLLRGRCRHCGAHISALHPAIEVAALVLVLWAATVTDGYALVASSLLGWTLLTLAVIDWKSHLLPDALTFFLLAAGLAATATLDPAAVGDHFTGAAAGFVVFWMVAKAYRHYRKREGLGLGDAKLLSGIGAWVSWTGLPSVILAGTALGLVFAAAGMIGGRRISGTDPIPFGPFLAAAGWLVWLYGPVIPA